MAITFINAASTIQAASSAISISRPANSTAGDLLVAHIFVEDNSDRITSTRVPAGWSTAVNQTVGTRAIRQYVHYKILTTSEPTSYTWNLDAADEVVGIISAYRGTHDVTPIGNISVSTENAQTTAAVAPQITVTDSGNLVIICAGEAAGSTISGSWVPPTSFTERADVQTSTGAANISAVLADYIPSSTGATGAKTYSAPVGDYYLASLIEVKQYVPTLLVVSDGINSSIGNILNLEQEYKNLEITDATCASSGETINISEELTLEISNGYQLSASDSFNLEQEQNLSIVDNINSSFGENIVLTVNELGDIILFVSDYISPSAIDVTTAQLTAPDGKNAGTDFQSGLISDDTNPLPGIDLDLDKYTEIEFCLKAGPSASGVYDFRITSNGTELTTYSQTPSLTIYTEYILSLNDSVVNSISDTLDLIQENNLISLDGISQSISDTIQLIQEHNLEIADSLVLTISEEIVISGENYLLIEDCNNVSVGESINLSQEHELETLDSYVQSISEIVNLSEEQTLELLDGVQVSVAESIDLLQEHNLESTDGVTVAVGDAADLEQEHFLEILDGISLSVSEDLNILTEGMDIVYPENGIAISISDLVYLIQEHNLEISDSIVASFGDSVELSQEQNIIISDGHQASVAEEQNLIQEHELSVADSASESIGDLVLLTVEELEAISISDGFGISVSDSINIIQEHELETSDAVVKSSADAISIIEAGEDLLTVFDGICANESDTLALSEEQSLETLDGFGVSIVDDLILLQEHILETSDCYNPNHVESIELEIEHWLDVSDSIVQTVGDFVNIYSFVLGTIIDPHLVSVTLKRSLETLTPAWMVQSIKTCRTIEQGDK